MRERTAAILTALVREYVGTGAPVSSATLYGQYDFGIKPAMIRFELNDLEETGYLEQPHQSSGRVPTDKGYELFAERALRDAEPTARATKRLERHRSTDTILGMIAEELGALEVLCDAAGRLLEREGLDRLVGNLEWSSKQALSAIIRDVESLDERLEHSGYPLGQESFLRIFIGAKSPITESAELAVIAADYRLNDRRVVVWSIGPKRMDYERAASLFKGLKRIYS